jgi:hypothetical protein
MDPRASVTPSIRNFAQAIDRQRQGLERLPLLSTARADLAEVSLALDEAEAAALAILAGENLELFAEAARAVSVPVLRTDVLSEEFRVYESRSAGADAVLLSAQLPLEVLKRLVQAASSTHMTACVVCASGDEIAKAASARADAIAVDPSLLHLDAPPRTLVISLSFDPSIRGRADAALDPSLADPQALRRALEEEP